ncbi:LAGLIDADG family homing endonuclease [Peribacillus sp. SCS-155]|uniref:LAGLIDADG family homing endonuclease n=1 Tax=Peribacillus sedimenti TaxID=3115297 RepID=UPI003905EBB2
MPRGNRLLSDEEIIKLYKSGMPFKQLEPLAGIGARAIRNIMYKHGIEMNREPHSGQPRRYKVNEKFFSEWTNRMAWVLGLIITDGHINPKHHQLGLTQKDENILRKVAEYMGADYRLGTISKTRKTPVLIINSAKVVQDLNNLGVYARKSLTVEFPKAPKMFRPSLVRGVIDGDGWVHPLGYVLNVTSGSLLFAEGLLSVFQSWGLRSEIRTQSTPKGNPIYRIWVSGKHEVARLAEIIYEDVEPGAFVIYKRERMSQRLYGQLSLF